jgi:hypothetical protein
MTEENKQIYPSWKFDENTNKWHAPVEKPSVENVSIRWNEFYKRWDLYKKPYPSWILQEVNNCGETRWVPPVKRPTHIEGFVDLWDEETQTWQSRNSLI